MRELLRDAQGTVARIVRVMIFYPRISYSLLQFLRELTLDIAVRSSTYRHCCPYKLPTIFFVIRGSLFYTFWSTFSTNYPKMIKIEQEEEALILFKAHTFNAWKICIGV